MTYGKREQHPESAAAPVSTPERLFHYWFSIKNRRMGGKQWIPGPRALQYLVRSIGRQNQVKYTKTLEYLELRRFNCGEIRLLLLGRIFIRRKECRNSLEANFPQDWRQSWASLLKTSIRSDLKK